MLADPGKSRKIPWNCLQDTFRISLEMNVDKNKYISGEIRIWSKVTA
jgi:hypothetical protein